jgi:hypothetical protein
MACPYSFTRPYLKAFEFKGWGCAGKRECEQEQHHNSNLCKRRIQSRPKHDKEFFLVNNTIVDKR